MFNNGGLWMQPPQNDKEIMHIGMKVTVLGRELLWQMWISLRRPKDGVKNNAKETDHEESEE